jgi:hypothetical protein
MRRPSVIALAALLAGVGGGCKDEKKDEQRYEDPMVFCAELVDQWAGIASRCAKFTPEAAEWALGFMIDCDRIHAAMQAGRVGYDAGAAEACIDAFQDATCDVDIGDAVPEVCDDVLVGKVPPGGSCTLSINQECIGGWCSFDACDAPGACVAYRTLGQTCGGPAQECSPELYCDGTCRTPVPPTVLTLGDPCNVPNTVCGTGLWCDEAMFVPVCQARKTSGDCLGDGECAVGYECRTGTCLPWLQPGDACVVGAEKPCVIGAYCGEDGKCHAWVGVGFACGPILESDYIECLGSWCKPTGMSDTGTCVAYLAHGATCDLAGPWSQCGPGWMCAGDPASCVESYCGGL